jgi:hypothetical protein
MQDSLPFDLVQALELFALERRSDYTFVPVTPPPAWFRHAVPDVKGPIALADVLPFLERFLKDAETFWREGTRRSLLSGAFTSSSEGEEILLRACALNVGPRSVLVLERLRGQEDMRGVLQKARDNKLEHERVLKRIDSLRSPLATLTRLTKALGQTELTDAQKQLVEGIGNALARIEGVTAELLPPLRRG